MRHTRSARFAALVATGALLLGACETEGDDIPDPAPEPGEADLPGEEPPFEEEPPG